MMEAVLLNGVTTGYDRRDVLKGIDLAVEEGVAIVVAGREDHVAHPRLPGKLHPPVGIELAGLESLGQLGVLGLGDSLLEHDPFPPGRDCIQPPVYEHPKASFRPPFHPVRDPLCHRSASALLMGYAGTCGLKSVSCPGPGPEPGPPRHARQTRGALILPSSLGEAGSLEGDPCQLSRMQGFEPRTFSLPSWREQSPRSSSC